MGRIEEPSSLGAKEAAVPEPKQDLQLLTPPQNISVQYHIIKAVMHNHWLQSK